jgi:hypothetical protein
VITVDEQNYDITVIKGCVVTDIDYKEDDSTIIITLVNSDEHTTFELQIRAVGRHCDDFWLAFSVEKVD